jgi:hypothetical protein
VMPSASALLKTFDCSGWRDIVSMGVLRKLCLFHAVL